MIQKNVERLVKTIKSWSDEDKKIAILVVESVRDCFSTEERLVEKKEENGQILISEGNFLTTEFTELISKMK